MEKCFFMAVLVNIQGAENGDLVALEKQGTTFFAYWKEVCIN